MIASPNPANIRPKTMRNADPPLYGAATIKIIGLSGEVTEAGMGQFRYLSHMHLGLTSATTVLLGCLRRTGLLVSIGLLLVPAVMARSDRPLRIYFIDV